MKRKDNRERHESTCKYKTDPIRVLERKLGIQVEREEGNECRYCKKGFARRGNVTIHQMRCKERDIYAAELVAKMNDTEVVEDVKDFVRRNVIKVNPWDETERFLARSGKMIPKMVMYDVENYNNNVIKWETGKKVMLKTHRELKNMNLRVTNIKSDVIYCYDGEKYIPEDANVVINMEMKDCARDIRHLMSSMNDQGVMRFMEALVEVLGTPEYTRHHKRAIMTELAAMTIDNRSKAFI